MDSFVSNSQNAVRIEPNVLSRILLLLSSQQENAEEFANDMVSKADKKITRACDTCRKKKIKCDWNTPKCGPCIKYDTSCVFTPSVRATRHEKKNMNRTVRLETRLTRIEQLLKTSGLSSESQISSSSLTKLENHLLSDLTVSKKRNFPGPISKYENSDQRGLSASTDKKVDLSYDPNYSVSSQWQVGEGFHPELQGRKQVLSTDYIEVVPERYGPVPLPPIQEALGLIQLYFSNLNQIFPLFHQQSFMQLINERYVSGSRSHRHPAIWCTINVVLALAYRLRAMMPDKVGDEHQKGAEHLQNSLAVASDIVLYGSDLLSVQSLLGIAEILQGTSSPRSYSMLVAAAARLAYTIGLHKEAENCSSLTPEEIEQRRRVFWIVNILDKDISVRSGVPPLVDTDDTDLPLPGRDSTDSGGYIYLNNGEGSINIFCLRVRLSIIDGLVYRTLYSTTAMKQSDDLRAAAVKDLDTMLKEWREGVPIKYSRDELTQKLAGFSTIHLLILHSFYFHTLVAVHRHPSSNKFRAAKPTRAVQTFDPLNFAANESCLKAAREFIDLISSMPRGDYAYIWVVLHSSISALITLLHNVLHNPQQPTAAADVECVNPLIDILPIISQACEDSDILRDVLRMHTFCVELKRRALVSMNRYQEELAFQINLRHHLDDNADGLRVSNLVGDQDIFVQTNLTRELMEPEVVYPFGDGQDYLGSDRMETNHFPEPDLLEGSLLRAIADPALLSFALDSSNRQEWEGFSTADGADVSLE